MNGNEWVGLLMNGNEWVGLLMNGNEWVRIADEEEINIFLP